MPSAHLPAARKSEWDRNRERLGRGGSPRDPLVAPLGETRPRQRAPGADGNGGSRSSIAGLASGARAEGGAGEGGRWRLDASASGGTTWSSRLAPSARTGARAHTLAHTLTHSHTCALSAPEPRLLLLSAPQWKAGPNRSFFKYLNYRPASLGGPPHSAPGAPPASSPAASPGTFSSLPFWPEEPSSDPPLRTETDTLNSVASS